MVDSKKVQDFKAQQFEPIPAHKLIWTPDHPLFWEVLHEQLPPLHSSQLNQNERMFAPNPETGVLEFIHIDDLAEYLYGGAFEEAENRYGQDEED
jgi:hypothetical protein